MTFKTKCEAERYTGGLSKPEKMPCPAWNLQPIATCNVGARLAQIPGSVCAVCYGTQKSSRYVRFARTMQGAWDKRYLSTQRDLWVPAMVKLIQTHEFFRWHDTGDVYSRGYFDMIRRVCEQTPETRHWLPTKEFWIANYDVPDNLLVRYSAPMIDIDSDKAEGMAARFGHIATVSTGESMWRCMAIHKESRSGGLSLSCGDCRACWDESVPIVDYLYHGRN
jgi:hypothetical protein